MTGLRVRVAALIAAGAIALAGPARAQDAEPTPTGGDGPALEFPNVEVDEDGNVTVVDQGGGGVAPTTEATTAPAEPTPAADATEAPATGGDIEPTQAPSTTVSVPSASGGLPLVPIGIGVAVLAAAAVGAVALRQRRRAADGPQVETPVAPDHGVADFAADMAPPAYRGAQDAGAYQVGGAAYVQHTQAAYGAADTTESRRSGVSNQLRTVRTQLATVADAQLEAAGKSRTLKVKLRAAGSEMTPGEWLVSAIGFTLLGLTIGLLLANPIIALLLGAAGASGSWMWIGRKEAKRQKDFAQQLPETLGLLAGSLRGGMSMIQSIVTIAEEADEPTRDEFQRVVTEIRLGRDMAQSFRDMAARMQSADFEWAVTSIEIHREVGGDLAAILDRVADTIRARNRVFGQMKALSAEGRMSGYILFFLPPSMVGMISLLNKGYLGEMTGRPAGIAMLVGAGTLLMIGGAWMKKLIKFEY